MRAPCRVNYKKLTVQFSAASTIVTTSPPPCSRTVQETMLTGIRGGHLEQLVEDVAHHFSVDTADLLRAGQEHEHAHKAVVRGQRARATGVRCEAQTTTRHIDGLGRDRIPKLQETHSGSPPPGWRVTGEDRRAVGRRGRSGACCRRDPPLFGECCGGRRREGYRTRKVIRNGRSNRSAYLIDRAAMSCACAGARRRVSKHERSPPSALPSKAPQLPLKTVSHRARTRR